MRFPRILAALLAIVTVATPITTTPAQDNAPIGVVIANLRDQLEKGLRARRPQEFVFIGRVVYLVQTNRLTPRLVLGTFQYAIQKDARVPFPYFERAMRIRAAEVGVRI